MERKAMLGVVEGGRLWLLITQHRIGDCRMAIEGEKNNSTLMLLSVVSKQMSTRLFRFIAVQAVCDIYAHTNTHTHAHTSSRINQCVLFSVISHGALLWAPSGEWGDKANQRRQSLTFSSAVLKLMFEFLFPLLSFCFPLCGRFH